MRGQSDSSTLADVAVRLKKEGPMNSKPTRRLFWMPLLIALAMVTSACADAATPAAAPAPPATPVTAETAVSDEVYLARAQEALAAPTSTPAFWPTGMPPPTRGPTAVPVLRPIDEALCRQAGGRWVSIERGCVELPTRDAGKPCSDGGECQSGWCAANLTFEAAEDLLEQLPFGQPLLMTGICSGFTDPPHGDRTLLSGGRLLYQPPYE